MLLHSVKYSELNNFFLHRETVTACCKNHVEHINTPCGQHTQPLVLNMAVHTLPPNFKSISLSHTEKKSPNYYTECWTGSMSLVCVRHGCLSTPCHQKASALCQWQVAIHQDTATTKKKKKPFVLSF